MVTEIDEGRGLVKTTWQAIRLRVAKVEPQFAQLVDAINPDETFPVYLAYYPYGELIGDTVSPFIPQIDGDHYRLSDPNAPKDVIKHLGYGKNSLPFGIILEKSLENFIDLKEVGISIPFGKIYSPGKIIPLTRLLTNKPRIFSPNAVLSAAAGARSVFMLPHISSTINHINLQRDYHVQSLPPKSFYEHWTLFKEIINSPAVKCDWRLCLAFFSEKWLDKLHHDPAWQSLKTYLHEVAWHRLEFERNRFYFDTIFTIIAQERHLKPNTYLLDTARHLITMAIGEAPGYAPACNNDFLPLDILQKAFIESYGLKKYTPTIMQPAWFDIEHNNILPIYYSLQNPSVYIFSPKSRQLTSTLFEMRELEHIMKIFVQELTKDGSMCADTTLYEILKKIQFNYFHNEKDSHRLIKPSQDIAELDNRFLFSNYQDKIPDAKFASDAKFLRGCISIQAKRNSNEK